MTPDEHRRHAERLIRNQVPLNDDEELMGCASDLDYASVAELIRTATVTVRWPESDPVTTPVTEAAITAAADAIRAEGDAPYDEYASAEELDRIQTPHYREAAVAALTAALPELHAAWLAQAEAALRDRERWLAWFPTRPRRGDPGLNDIAADYLRDTFGEDDHVWPDGAAVTHVYLSTACLHGHHDYCAGTLRQDGGTKEPACCKWCGSPCVCTTCNHQTIACVSKPERPTAVPTDRTDA